MKKLLALGILVLAAFAGRAHAAPQVSFALVMPTSTTWQLYVQDSIGDNVGIASIGATVINATTTGLGHLTVDGPTGQITQDPGMNLGFTGLAQSTRTVAGGTGLNFAIYQPAQVNLAGEYVYTLGQSAGSFTAEMAGAPGGPYTATGVANDSFSVPFLIAQGTNALGATPSLWVPDLSADVFINQSSTTLGAAVAFAIADPPGYTLGATAGSTQLHVGGSTTISSTITNMDLNVSSGYMLDFTGLGASISSGSGAVSGSPSNGGPLAYLGLAGSSASNTSQTFTGSVAGTVTLAPTVASATNHIAGGASALISTTPVTITVYTGQSTWSSINSTGNWSDYANWNATGGAPGIYSGFTTGDTATFPTVSPSMVTVSLNGANPSLTTLTFNSTSSGYNITGTGGGTLALKGSGAAVNVTGRHTISAPLALGSNTTITTTSSASALVISGNISGSGTSLTATGPGLVNLCGANSYTGATTISAGTLQFGDGTSGHDGSLASNSIVNNASVVFDTYATQSTSAGIGGSGKLSKIGPGTLTVSGTDTCIGGTTVSAGTLQINQITTGSLTIAAGAKTVLITSAGTNPRASIVVASALSIAGTGALDLTDNGLIITGASTTTEAAIASLISGHEITSSVVSAHTGMAIAYDFANDIHLNFVGGSASWGGQTITSAASTTDLLVFPTLNGDTNMDGTVNFTDVTALAPNLGKSGQTWGGGDFNGDGLVNFTDVTALAPNLGKSVAGLSAPNFEGTSSVSSGVSASPATVIPEPASLALLALGGLLVLPRRRG